MMTKTPREESQVDDEGKEREQSRRSTQPNTRRIIETKTSPEGSEGDERTVTVTTQESQDGIREKAMRIACIEELETGNGAARWSTQGRRE